MEHKIKSKLKKIYNFDFNKKNFKNKIFKTFIIGFSFVITLGIVVSALLLNNQVKTLAQEKASIIGKSSSLISQMYLQPIESGIDELVKNKSFCESVNILVNSKEKPKGSIKGITNDYINTLQSQLDLYTSGNDVVNIYVATNNDKIIMSPQKDLGSSFSHLSKTWYKDITSGDNFTWSEPYLDESSNTVCISGGMTIKDKNGSVLGVLAVDVNFEKIEDIANLNLGKDGFFLILKANENKYYSSIYTSDKELSDDISGKKIVSKISDDKTEIKQTGIDELINFTDSKDNKESNKLNNITINNRKYSVNISKDEIEEWYYITGVKSSYFFNIIFSFTILLFITCFLAIIPLKIYYSKKIKSLDKDLNKINSFTKDIRDGNLNIFIEGEILNNNDETGEIANNLNNMVNSYKYLIEELKETCNIISSSSNNLLSLTQITQNGEVEISNSMQLITDSTLKQSDNIESGIDSVANFSFELQEITKHSKDMLDLVNDINEKSKNNLIIINELKSTTIKNNNITLEIISNIEDLESKTGGIYSIVDTISQIADRTNLLSLNASIESARAGVVGLGFSVVAEEIKKLSDQSSKSANEINLLIDSIKNDIIDAVNDINDIESISQKQAHSTEKVNNSFESIYNSLNTINESTTKVNDSIIIVNEKIDTVMTSIESIATISQEITISCQNVSNTIHEQISTTEEINSYCEELNNYSNKLSDNINKFDLK